jgi:hypothetical protein
MSGSPLPHIVTKDALALPDELPEKIQKQIQKVGLPTAGQVPFVPSLVKNRKGEATIAKAPVLRGPKKGKVGYLDSQGRIWIKDRAHAGVPDHWDVQVSGGDSYFRVDLSGNLLT